jgi:hypothetical protein
MTNDQVKILAQEWERARLGTKDYIDAMTNDKLDFRPVPGGPNLRGPLLARG